MQKNRKCYGITHTRHVIYQFNSITILHVRILFVVDRHVCYELRQDRSQAPGRMVCYPKNLIATKMPNSISTDNTDLRDSTRTTMPGESWLAARQDRKQK